MATPVFDPARVQAIPGRAYLDRAPEPALPRSAAGTSRPAGDQVDRGNAGTATPASRWPAFHAPVEDRPVEGGPVWDGPAWEALVDQVPGVDDDVRRSEPGWAEVERLESPEVVADLLFRIWIAPYRLTLPPDPDDAWLGVDRVPPRPLLGVTGCAGPGLATGLGQVDPRRLTPGQLVEVLTGAERLIRWAQGLQLSAAAGLAEYATIVDPDRQDDPLFGGERAVEVGFSSPREIGEFCADGIGAALGTNHIAGRQLIQAGCMTAELPVIQELLAVGLLDLPRVKALLRELCRVPDLAADLDWVNQVIREHHLLTPRLLGNTVRKLVMERYPEQAETGRKAAKQRRRVSVEPCEDGMAMFKAFLSAEDALMAYRALTEAAWLDHDHQRHADQQPSAYDEGEYIGIDALRADAFSRAMYDLHDATMNADDDIDSADDNSADDDADGATGGHATGDEVPGYEAAGAVGDPFTDSSAQTDPTQADPAQDRSAQDRSAQGNPVQDDPSQDGASRDRAGRDDPEHDVTFSDAVADDDGLASDGCPANRGDWEGHHEYADDDHDAGGSASCSAAADGSSDDGSFTGKGSSTSDPVEDDHEAGRDLIPADGTTVSGSTKNSATEDSGPDGYVDPSSYDDCVEGSTQTAAATGFGPGRSPTEDDHEVEDDLEVDRLGQSSATSDPPAASSSYQDQQGPTQAPAADPPAPDRTARRARKKHRRRDPARSMLHVYMLGSTAAGLDNKPADLLGYGPITAEHARAITENADLMRILLDPFTGDIRSIDSPAYRIPKVLRWAAQARDKTCTFPGCAVPADETEIDHIIPHPFARKLDKALAHGTTTLSNLTSLCKRHHRAKTHSGWIIEATESGDWLNWIAPTGHHYRRLAHWGPPKGFWTDHQEHLMRTSASDPAPF